MSSQFTLSFNVCICGDTDCKIPYGYCHCGCGEHTKLSRQTRTERRDVAGKPQKYLHGHNATKITDDSIQLSEWPNGICICGVHDCEIQFGLCYCGCGEKTVLAICTVPKLGRIKGLPAKYVGKHRVRKEEPLISRFWKKIDKNGPIIRNELGHCWMWMASLDHNGYGQINGEKEENGEHKTLKAHRVSWEINRGPIPERLGVLHKCDNPPCCNPEHLFLGNNDENMKDAASKGRLPRGKNHHNGRFTEDEVRNIRAMWKERKLTQAQIGEKFGVSRSCILAILRKDNYAYVDG